MSDYVLYVDASSLFARAFFAVKGEGAVGAAFHSLRCLLRHERLPRRPTHLLCAWDAWGGAKHDKERGPKPDGYHEARFEVMERIESEYGRGVNVEEGEADDVVAAGVYACREAGHRCVVASGDKDLSALQEESVDFFYLPIKRLLRREEICAKWGIHRPSHLAIVLALTGDSVDKIAGVPGYGPKRTKKLLECLERDMPLGQAYERVREALEPQHRNVYDHWFALTCLFGTSCPPPVALPSDPLFDA